MQLSRFRRKNVFCIEGNWNNSLKGRTGIKAALDFLEHNANLKHIHKNCSTIGQFESLLKDAVLQEYNRYGIIYIAFHGFPGELLVGKRQRISLEQIAVILQGKAKDKIIHFGSCSTLAVPRRRVNKFLRETGALAISGYTKDVDFIPSTFLDILYFQFCEQYRKIPLIHRDVKKYYGKMANELGFKMFYKK
jgi:hypothetical protein